MLQAATARDALRLAATERPDLILSNSRLAGQSADRSSSALRRIDGAWHGFPILMLQTGPARRNAKARCAPGLTIFSRKPLSEALLLARLRNLLRQRFSIPNWRAPDRGDAAALPRRRRRSRLRGRIAIIGKSRADALALRAQIAAQSHHSLDALTMLDRTNPPARRYLHAADRHDQAEDGLRLLADLKAARPTRDSPVIALLDADTGRSPSPCSTWAPMT